MQFQYSKLSSTSGTETVLEDIYPIIFILRSGHDVSENGFVSYATGATNYAADVLILSSA